MALPGVTQTILSTGLGLAQVDPSKKHIKIGSCSGGTANTLVWHTDPQALRTALGYGPLTASGVHHLEIAGGPVGFMKVATTTAGVAGSVTKTGTGTGTMTVAGASYDTYQVKVEVTANGTNIAAGTGRFKYSLDNGDSYSGELAIPTGGSYAIPNTNLTITFVNGGSGTSFIDGDVHAFDTTAPIFSTSDLAAAFDALRALGTEEFGWIHVVGQAAAGSGSASIAATIDTKMTAEANAFRYAFCVMEAADDTDGNLQSAFASFVSDRTVVCAGFVELASSGVIAKRHCAWPIVARVANQSIQRDLARTRPDREGGSLPGVVSIYRDERTTEALDAARFTTLRTYAGQPGFFITNGRTMAATGSDFAYLQYRRLMDRACTINYDTMFPHLNDDELRVDAETGYINEIDARALESQVNQALKSQLTSKNYVSDTFVRIRRDNNILSTQTLLESVRIVPKGYSKFIEAEIGFLNPALLAQQAA